MPTLTMVADGLPTIKETILPAGARREHGRLIMDKSGYEAQAVTWTSAVLAQPDRDHRLPPARAVGLGIAARR